jgi:hypothetical protein
MSLTTEAREFLLRFARRAIHRGLPTGDPGSPEFGGCPPEALGSGASFVTLTNAAGELRGCRGSLDARRPLAADVWHNAAASAFADPRFAPVTAAELIRLRVEISVLGPLEPIAAASETELGRLLVPHCDGVVIEWRSHRATFLPQVWEVLPDAMQFMAQLKMKAGLPANFWAKDLVVQRYRVEKIRDATRSG